jgi:5-methylcytosine-specific restriction endonuclease McrA
MPPRRKATTTEKKCSVCKNIKPIAEFYKDVRRGDGYYTACKTCHDKSVRRWQAEHQEKIKATRAEYKKTHREGNRLSAKKWTQEHPASKRNSYMKWRSEHPDYAKTWRSKNKDKIKHYTQNRRARLSGNGGMLKAEEWDAILDFYGNKCLCCGRDDVKLTIDHVLPIFHGGKHSADNVQPLCGPCNSRKKDKHIDYRKEKYHAPSGH